MTAALIASLAADHFGWFHMPIHAINVYDATAASMIDLRYESGFPSNRLEGLEDSLAIRSPTATQCKIVAETAAVLQPAYEELIRQVAQGSAQ